MGMRVTAKTELSSARSARASSSLCRKIVSKQLPGHPHPRPGQTTGLLRAARAAGRGSVLGRLRKLLWAEPEAHTFPQSPRTAGVA